MAFRAAGETAGAPIDLADGYIHFSTAAQVAETAAKYFADRKRSGAGRRSTRTALVRDLKWEPSRGGALVPASLPHACSSTDVVWDKSLPLGATGHIFPEGMW